jgi:hypothetical protein
MRVFDLFFTISILSINRLDAIPPLSGDLGGSAEQLFFVPSEVDVGAALNAEATMLHVVFRIIREQFSIFHNVIVSLAGRR